MTQLTTLGSIFIVQLRRFIKINDSFVKDNTKVGCLENLKIKLHDNNEVSFTTNYELAATINHSGSLENGHYWAYIKDADQKAWLACNDKLVSIVEPASLTNSSSYVLFYRKV